MSLADIGAGACSVEELGTGLVQCADGLGPDLKFVSGCGVDSVEEWGTHGSATYCDSKTGQVIGALTYDDVPWSLAGCRDFEFIAGRFRPPCKRVTTQSWCWPTTPALDAGIKGRSDAGRNDAGRDASTVTDGGS